MEEISNLTIFPKTHVKPFDGMSVTADTWLQSHEEHRQALRAHELFFHGSGIVCGLEVTANDPPDQFVFISPGVAVDPAGNVIVLSETVAYDFGAVAEGSLFLVIGHGERESGGVEAEVKYTHDEFVIAARPSLPKRPVVELARITLPAAGKPIQAAKDPSHPLIGELDCRYRLQLVTQALRSIQMAVCSLGSPVPEVASGWNCLARQCLLTRYARLIVDIGVSPSADLSHYDVVCLSGSGAFKSDVAMVKSLKAYLAAGKSLLVEALDPAAEKAFTALFEKLELNLQPLSADDSLLTTPHLFPPASLALLWRDKGVIYSTGGFSPAWTGKDAATRSDIRSAHEWGMNLLTACL